MPIKGYYGHIEDLTLQNNNFRQVIFTGNQSQLVLMTLQPNEDIGLETHDGNDQFFRFEHGNGKVIIGDETFEVADGDCVVIPSVISHNIINTSATDTLKMYTLYSPAHHPEGTVHKTKAEAMEAEEEDHK